MATIRQITSIPTPTFAVGYVIDTREEGKKTTDYILVKFLVAHCFGLIDERGKRKVMPLIDGGSKGLIPASDEFEYLGTCPVWKNKAEEKTQKEVFLALAEQRQERSAAFEDADGDGDGDDSEDAAGEDDDDDDGEDGDGDGADDAPDSDPAPESQPAVRVSSRRSRGGGVEVNPTPRQKVSRG